MGWRPIAYEEIHLRDRLQAPSAQYLLGTDHVGRDLLSRLIHGAHVRKWSYVDHPPGCRWSWRRSYSSGGIGVGDFNWLHRSQSSSNSS